MSSLGDQADALRAKAGEVFAAQARRSGFGRPGEGDVYILVGEIPNGKNTVLRVFWGQCSGNGGGRELRLRGFERSPSGTMHAIQGFGLSIHPSQLPGLAATIADALDQIAVSDRGLRFRPPPASSDGATPSLAMADDDSRPTSRGGSR